MGDELNNSDIIEDRSDTSTYDHEHVSLNESDVSTLQALTELINEGCTRQEQNNGQPQIK